MPDDKSKTPVMQMDEKDRELAALRAKVEALEKPAKKAKATPPPYPDQYMRHDAAKSLLLVPHLLGYSNPNTGYPTPPKTAQKAIFKKCVCKVEIEAVRLRMSPRAFCDLVEATAEFKAERGTADSVWAYPGFDAEGNELPNIDPVDWHKDDPPPRKPRGTNFNPLQAQVRPGPDGLQVANRNRTAPRPSVRRAAYQG